MKQSHAFTLIELLVVVALASSSSPFVVPLPGRRRSPTLSGACRLTTAVRSGASPTP